MPASSSRIVARRQAASAATPQQHADDSRSREWGLAHASSRQKARLFYHPVQFAFPQRHPIAIIVALTLRIADYSTPVPHDSG